MDKYMGEQKAKQIKKDIEFKIIVGEYQAGQRIPSIRDMSKLYPISVPAAQSVLLQMSAEKTIVLDLGIGYKVSSQAAKELLNKYEKEFYNIILGVCEDAVKIGINPVNMLQEIINKMEM